MLSMIQMKKIAESAPNVAVPVFTDAWFHLLAEVFLHLSALHCMSTFQEGLMSINSLCPILQYMMTQQAPFVRRQVRKLLLYVCGSKDTYRLLRDTHALEKHMAEIHHICQKAGLSDRSFGDQLPIILPYDVLINLIEHVKACTEVASVRTLNWQKFCQKDECKLCILPHFVIIQMHCSLITVLVFNSCVDILGGGKHCSG